ncbi:hypothetical protein F2Q68_00044922 [Brassica cretica]|uniref:Uncharacterized protein n=1 Tax=Brassica cretica TaxID=69181 RepID=A0A8S9LIU3_BRACR|nr:hypothetical protein F2Q68_00044922 [Brassica cretica]
MVSDVDGLEGQEELCFVNANGTWENYSQGFSSKGNQSTQGQAGSSTSAPQESSTDAMLKRILESQIRSEKHIGYELKNLHTKVDESYNDLNNKLIYGTEVVVKAEAQIVEKVEHKIVERVKIQTVKKVEGKVLQPVRHKAEKPVIGKAVMQLKEVQLEEAHVVEQSPYDKLPFPQKFLTKAQKKVISKFRKDMGDTPLKRCVMSTWKVLQRRG